MTLAVIIPNFNNEKYLPKCLESVLSQTLLPDEIIVVDDCSTDNSKSIIREYEKKSSLVKGIFLDKNSGVSHARNTGIINAQSEFVTTLDADDFYFDSKKLENEMKILSQHNGRAVAYSKLVYSNENDEIIRYLDYKKREYFEGMIYKSLLKEKIRRTLMRDCCYPKSVLINAGLYDENCSLFEDYDVLIKLAKELPFYCTFEYGTAYRRKSGGLSDRSRDKLLKAKSEVIEKNLETLSKIQRTEINLYRLSNNTLRKMLKWGATVVKLKK